ncbi:MAG: DUF456 domain-containing protein [Vicinamibacterales bacterium]
MDVLVVALGALIALVGLAGLIVPAVPGLPLVFLGIALVSWADGFTRIGLPTLMAVAVLGLLGAAFDYAAGLLGAKRAGASRWGLFGALVGMLAGLPFGLIGLVIGPGLGAMAFEYVKDTDIRKAARAGVGVLVGFVLGTAMKYAVAMTMIGLAVLAYVF